MPGKRTTNLEKGGPLRRPITMTGRPGRPRNYAEERQYYPPPPPAGTALGETPKRRLKSPLN